MSARALQFAAISFKALSLALALSLLMPWGSEVIGEMEGNVPAPIGWAFVILYFLINPVVIVGLLFCRGWWLKSPALIGSGLVMFYCYRDYVDGGSDPYAIYNFWGLVVCICTALVFERWHVSVLESHDGY